MNTKQSDQEWLQKRIKTLNVRINNNKKIITELERECEVSQAELNKIESERERHEKKI